jgi:excisionase family DNA binding protein
MTPEQAARCSGMARTRIYDLIASGELRSHLAYGKRIIYRDDLEAYINSLPEWVPGRDVTAASDAPATPQLPPAQPDPQAGE